MRSCSVCGTQMDDSSVICPECGHTPPYVSLSEEDQKSYANHQPSVRPSGISVITTLVCIGAFFNLYDGLSFITIIPLLAVFNLGLAVLQLIVAYGIWKMKTWGANGASLLYVSTIIVSGVIAFILPEIIVGVVITTISNSLPYGYEIDEAAIDAIIRSSLLFSFFLVIAFGVIIVGYTHSRKDLFVN